jgi:hypothetical protein
MTNRVDGNNEALWAYSHVKMRQIHYFTSIEFYDVN